MLIKEIQSPAGILPGPIQIFRQLQIIMPERAANAGKVYPDLVGPPGVKTAAYQRKMCLP